MQSAQNRNPLRHPLLELREDNEALKSIRVEIGAVGGAKVARVGQRACPWWGSHPNAYAQDMLEGSGYLGVHSGDSGLQYSLCLNLLPDRQAADSHGFRFHGLQGDEGGHFVTQAQA